MKQQRTRSDGRRSLIQWLHDLSLTTRLIAVVVGLTLMAYVVTTLLTVSLLRDYLTDVVDRDLHAAMDQIGRAAAAPPGTSALDQFLGGPGASYAMAVAQWDATDPSDVQVRVGGWGDASPTHRPDLAPEVFTDPARYEAPFNTSGVDDGDVNWRVLIVGIQGGEGSVAIATPLTRVDSTTAQVTLLMTVIGLCILMAVALLSWFAVRRAFRPLTRIEDTARAIAQGDLTRRIPHRGGRDEVASLSSSLNVMLSRIEQAFAARHASEVRMRRFVADASHELRTPLATVRGYAELYRVGGVRSEEDVDSAMRRIEHEATRMSRLVEDLLLLTRLDNQPSFERVPVDLTVLAADTVQDARVRAPERDIRVVPLQGATGPVMTKGDDHSLRQVLLNLVGNAVAHTPEDASIEVGVGYVGTAAVVEVRDRGPGIPAEVADRVFERFFRADASRSRDKGGTGLGLAIVAAIIGSHRGRVRYQARDGGGAIFRVELPAAPVLVEED